MRILVISDTHGDLHTTKKALESQPTAEVIIHCGDSRDELDYIERTVRNKAVIAVKGNCDFGSQLPLEEVRPIGGKRFLICHGHMYNVKYGLQNLEYAAREKQADIAVYGHTHYAVSDYIDGLYLLNPGHCSGYGATCAYIDITDKGDIVTNIIKL
ncbi:MAG: metallophosphoesterase [Ruminococcus sp.]|nr:metallophosphoesterase [Ruminococcus sp.]MBQ1815405.1 metallophosphoesterase [Ruminococcus sp.]MEE0674990.1 metallophosphoesterase [Ruminococcus sp.]